MKLEPLHEPKSIVIVPLLIAADLLENPVNSSVCDDARLLTVIDASNAVASDWSATLTLTALLSEPTEKPVDPFA